MFTSSPHTRPAVAQTLALHLERNLDDEAQVGRDRNNDFDDTFNSDTFNSDTCPRPTARAVLSSQPFGDLV